MKQKQNVDELPRHVNSPKPGGKLHSKHRPEKKVVPGAELFILLQKELQKRDFFGTLGILYVYDWAKYVYCLQICLTQPFRTMNLKFILFLHSSTKFGIPKSLKVGYWMSLTKWDVDMLICFHAGWCQISLPGSKLKPPKRRASPFVPRRTQDIALQLF